MFDARKTAQQLQRLVGKTVEVTGEIEEFDEQFIEGQRAKVVSISLSDGYSNSLVVESEVVWKVIFDVSEFEDFNFPLDPAQFYDKDGTPCLKAHQTDYYSQKPEVYLATHGGSLSTYFNVIDDDHGDIYRQYQVEQELKSKKDHMGYIAWLEEKVHMLQCSQQEVA